MEVMMDVQKDTLLRKTGSFFGSLNPFGDKADHTRNVLEFVNNIETENADGVGVWGGSCTCPDGQVYQVGDNNNDCNSLACIGGEPSTCHKVQGTWSKRKVEC